jgi:hypothetical protein
MWNKILQVFGYNPQPKCWAIFQITREEYPIVYGRWVKFVGYECHRDPWHPERVRGPFRSEVDCDEFCQTSNGETADAQ